MRIINKAMGGVLAATLAMGLIAGTASAQTLLKLNQVGAALALPLLGDENGQAVTYLTITNVGPDDRNLHFNVIKGNGWEVTDFDCPVTASETVLITWLPGPQVGQYTFFLECNFGGVAQNRVVSKVFNWDRGIAFVANETHECKNGTCTTNENDLFGDFITVNNATGFAYSAGAIPFQGLDPLAPGITDREYHFDNVEYSMFPATLATNFIAPGEHNLPGDTLLGTVGAELVLFILDGRANVGSQAALDILFYDDEETPTSAHYTFDCFSVVSLENINVNFNRALLGSEAGHMFMHTIDHDQRSNAHDLKYGNGNGIRIVGVHGWLVQSISDGDVNGVAAWSRTLAQGMDPQPLDGTDQPTFDGL